MAKRHAGRRMIAAFIDYSIIITINFFLIFTFGQPLQDQPETYELTGFPALVTMIPWLIFTVCLEYFLGSTFGNGIVGLKPVTQENQNKISFLQSFKRHLLDPIDMFFFGLVGYLVMKSNQNGQRLGDIFAKTIVVKYRH